MNKTPKSKSPVTVITEAVAAGTMAKSEAIRQLAALGVSRWDTSKVLGIRYQFVRNVLVRESDKVARQASKAADIVPVTRIESEPEVPTEG